MTRLKLSVKRISFRGPLQRSNPGSEWSNPLCSDVSKTLQLNFPPIKQISEISSTRPHMSIPTLLTLLFPSTPMTYTPLAQVPLPFLTPHPCHPPTYLPHVYPPRIVPRPVLPTRTRTLVRCPRRPAPIFGRFYFL